MDHIERWKEHAYPLKSVTIQLQGTRHTTVESLLHQLDEIKAQLMDGCKTGEHHDDDYGYRFESTEAQSHSIFPAQRG
jgi:hypothetical protein